MIYQLGKIKSLIEASTAVATGAGIPSMSGHVFIAIGEQDMTHNMNIGRLPIVYIKEIQVDYAFEAEPEHFGTRSAEYVLKICVPTFINRDESQYLKLERIKKNILSTITKNADINVTNVRTEIPIVSQMATCMDVRVTTETSYDENYQEGT